MTIDEFNTISTDALSELQAESPDTGKISGFLNSLREGFTEEVARAEAAEKSSTEFKEKNKSLQEANMGLFLKLGEQAKQEKGLDLSPKKPEPIDFNSLFDENGELK